MKSLSPNAQEFVPYLSNNHNQVQQASSTYYIIDPHSPILHQHQQIPTQTQPYGLINSAVAQIQIGHHVQFGYLTTQNSLGTISPLAGGLAYNPQIPIQTSHHDTHRQITISTTNNKNTNLNANASYPIYLTSDSIMSPIANQNSQYLLQPTNNNGTGYQQTVSNQIAQPVSPMHSYTPIQLADHQNYSYQSGLINGVHPPPPHPPPLSLNHNQFHQQQFNYGYNQHKQQQQQQQSFNEINPPLNNKQHKFKPHSNTQHNNQKYLLQKNHQNKIKLLNNSQIQQHQQQTAVGFDLMNGNNEKEWPKLSAKASKSIKKNENTNVSDDEEEVAIPPTEQPNKTPYLADANQLKKLIKNVNFIKTTIEQHYLTENNMNHNQKQQLSFKDAVLTKPTVVQEKKQVIVSNKKNSKENLNTLNNIPIDSTSQKPITSLAEPTTRKASRSRKRSRSKKNRSADASKNNNTRDSHSVDALSFKLDFNLKAEEFPDLLNTNPNKAVKSGGGPLGSTEISKSMTAYEDKNGFLSDAYSSDATLNASLRSKSTTQIKKDASEKTTNTVPTTSSVKSNKPITLDFANMISALEKGQRKEKSQGRLQQFTLNSLKNRHMQHLIRSKSLASSRNAIGSLVNSNSIVNPLDSIPIQKRGKEREKPKNKKQSTLKKIIIKEREEKRRLKQDQLKSNDELSIDTVGINSPITSAVELLLSPKHHSQLTHQEINVQVDTKNETTEESNLDSASNSNSPNKTDREKSDFSDATEKNTKNPEDEENEEDEEQHDETEENENAGIMSNQMSPISQGSPISIGGYSPSPYAALNNIIADRTLLSLEKLEEQVKQKIHSRKFREYCNQIINRDIDEVCLSLLHDIARFQDRLYHKNPTKAKIKRRYVMGIREVTKHLKLFKLKCIILAPNCEKIQSKGGLDDAINFIIQTSMEQNVPFVFALGRKGLGKAVNKLVPISVVGIFDYSGAEEHFKRLVDLANNAKLAYQEMVEEYEKEECENLILNQSLAVNNQAETILNKEILSTPTSNIQANGILYNNSLYSNHPKVPSHMAHSRTPSNGSNISIEPYFMNYHTHSRSASGNFNYGTTTGASGTGISNAGISGHIRSASGGGAGTVFANIDLSMHGSTKHWGTHSRTPSNCSNISFISRLSEPISEVGGSMGTLFKSNVNNSTSNLAPFFGSTQSNVQNSASNTINSAFVAVQYYNEQVRQEMGECEPVVSSTNIKNKDQTLLPLDNETCPNVIGSTVSSLATTSSSSSNTNTVINLQLGSINEIDAGNEADTESENIIDTKQLKQSKTNSKCSSPVMVITRIVSDLKVSKD